MVKISTTTNSQLEKLMSLPKETPLAVLNLFEYHKKAQYKMDDPEYGTERANVSGEKALQRYFSAAGKVLRDLGGRLIFSAEVDQVVIGPEDVNWDLGAIMFFPSRQAFIDMLNDSQFQKESRHRKAALANHYSIHLKGDAFKL